jgi:hypothetical protein
MTAAAESTMDFLPEFLPEAAAVPGRRISGYRNSSPRLIRLLGLGEQGSHIARKVAARGFSNVEVVTGVRPVGWDEIASDRRGERTNMVVIVCGEGDERLFGPARGKPDMLVTFVVLTEASAAAEADAPKLAQIRGQSDLFVTTSDADYVGELIDNLAS